MLANWCDCMACLDWHVRDGCAGTQVMQASFGGPVSSLFGRQLPLSVASPPDGCEALSNGAAVAGTVVLVQRGTCFFSQKVGARV